jgi:hypothetical protein
MGFKKTLTQDNVVAHFPQSFLRDHTHIYDK